MLGGNQVKTLRRTCAATILSLTLAISAFAGDVHCPGVASNDNTAPVTTDDSADDTASVPPSVILAVLSLIYG